MSPRRILFLIFLFLFIVKSTCLGEGVYYTPEGKAIKKFSIQRLKKKTESLSKKQTAQKKVVPCKKSAPKKKKPTIKKRKMTPREKIYSDAAAAAAAGYKAGQAVKVKNGIILRLEKEPKTGKYTFKKYRLKKNKKKSIVKKSAVPGGVIKAGAKEKKVSKPWADSVEKTMFPAVLTRKKEQHGGKGRNIKGLTASVNLRHSFFDRKTVITSRVLTTGDGTTVSTEPVTLGVGIEDTNYTDMHNDSLRLRLGLTDRVELFFDAGFAYDQLSGAAEMEPAFGGGVRVNLAQVEQGLLSGLYLALSGEYLQGELEMNYTAGSEEYLKITSWQEIGANLESGIVFSKLSVFAGLSYLAYTESITKKQIQELPDLTMLEDQLEQQGNINLSGGIEYHHSPLMTFLVEAQAPNRMGLVVGFEYRF